MTTQPDPAPGETVTTQTVPIAPPRQPRRIAYPSGGAKGKVYPPGDAAFEMLTQTGCTDLLSKSQQWEPGYPPPNSVPLRQVYLYRAAANACLSHWDAAVADFTNLTPLMGGITAAANASIDNCPSDAANTGSCPRCDQVVLAWLSEVVAAYRSDPGMPPVLTGTAAAVPC